MPHGMDFWNTVHGNCGQATWPGLLEHCPRQVPWPQTEDCAAAGPEGPATIVAMPHGMDFWNAVHGMCRGHKQRTAQQSQQLWPGHMAWTSGTLSTATVARPLGLDFWNAVHGRCRGHKQRTAQRPALKGQPQLWPGHLAWTSGILSTACAVAT
jgi:hypothetical protein